jgi:hypothetical protein
MKEMQRVPMRWIVCAMLATAALPPALACRATFARPGIDTSRVTQHRLGADSCILDAVIIYTDPYIGGRLTHQQVVANIAHMCARPFGLYSEDLKIDRFDAERLLRQTIEAGLRGQFRGERDPDAARPAGR